MRLLPNSSPHSPPHHPNQHNPQTPEGRLPHRVKGGLSAEAHPNAAKLSDIGAFVGHTLPQHDLGPQRTQSQGRPPSLHSPPILSSPSCCGHHQPKNTTPQRHMRVQAALRGATYRKLPHYYHQHPTPHLQHVLSPQRTQSQDQPPSRHSPPILSSPSCCGHPQPKNGAPQRYMLVSNVLREPTHPKLPHYYHQHRTPPTRHHQRLPIPCHPSF